MLISLSRKGFYPLLSVSCSESISFFSNDFCITTFPSPSSSSFIESGSKSTSYFYAAFDRVGGGAVGGGGLAAWLSMLIKLLSRRFVPFFPHLLSLISIGSPNSRSKVQTWQMFFYLLQNWQTQVLLKIPLFPFHLNTVKGRKHILHSWPKFYFSILKKGFSP